MILTTPPALEQDAAQVTDIPDDFTGITFLSMTGDITITWSSENDAKMKELIRKKMAEGFVFFTTRKVPLTNIPFKRRLGAKGVDSIKDLIISDEDFDKMVRLMDDADIATAVADGAGLAKRKDPSNRPREFQGGPRLKKPEDLKRGEHAVATRGLAGG